MVRLDKIVTKAGDGGRTRLATGEEISKASARVEAYGAVDEANSALGVARLHVDAHLGALITRIQNDLFDLGADLATPDSPRLTPLRIAPAQVERLEHVLDALNEDLSPLTSFVLPGGCAAAAHLHVARAIVRRAERRAVALAEAETVNPEAIRYLNRLSDFLFVAARAANAREGGDMIWIPGENR